MTNNWLASGFPDQLLGKGRIIFCNARHFLRPLGIDEAYEVIQWQGFGNRLVSAFHPLAQ